MADDTELSLLRCLKREMNGAVVEAMEKRGVIYPVNYGVSIPTIRSVAAQYAPNHELALRLFQSDVRELRLAALFIDEPSAVTATQMREWSAKFTNYEIVENTASRLFSKSPDAVQIVLEWMNSDDKMLCYAGLLTAAGVLRVAHGYRVTPVADSQALDVASRTAAQKPTSALPPTTTMTPFSHLAQTSLVIDEKYIDAFVDCAAKIPFRGDFDLPLSHGVVTLMERCARYSFAAHSKVTGQVILFNSSDNNLIRHTAGELSWRLEII